MGGERRVGDKAGRMEIELDAKLIRGTPQRNALGELLYLKRKATAVELTDGLESLTRESGGKENMDSILEDFVKNGLAKYADGNRYMATPRLEKIIDATSGSVYTM